MRTVGLGYQSFDEIRKKELFYIDKTEFIKEWFYSGSQATLITRPRRFGKSLTIDMINCFFSPEYVKRSDLFEGLAIAEDRDFMELQGSIPTIKVSFASVKAETYREFLSAMTGVITKLFTRFDFLLSSHTMTASDRALFDTMREKNQRVPVQEEELELFIDRIENSLGWLSEWLHTYYGKKVILLIDEYDTPVQAAYLNHYYEKAIKVLQELFFHALKGNEDLDRALLTGITRIAKESLFSDLNNLVVCSVIHGGYDTVFGFTGTEMAAILQAYNIEDRSEYLKYWYDGFTVGNATCLYNPWSVTCYLANRHLPAEAYWAQSGGVGLISHLVRQGLPGLLEGFQLLLQEGSVEKKIKEDLIFPRLSKDENAVWSLLVAAGYLKPVSGDHVSRKESQISLKLTNHEILLTFTDMIESWFDADNGNVMHLFADALSGDNLPEMNRLLAEVVQSCVSIFDSGNAPSRSATQPENFFHGLTLGMLVCLLGQYQVKSNRESGYGRYDLCLTPNDRNSHPLAYLFEFKVFDKEKGDLGIEDTAKRARQQIDDRRYDAELLANGFPEKDIRKYGIGFRGKDVRIVS
jgi:hypothetical protein